MEVNSRTGGAASTMEAGALAALAIGLSSAKSAPTPTKCLVFPPGQFLINEKVRLKRFENATAILLASARNLCVRRMMLPRSSTGVMWD